MRRRFFTLAAAICLAVFFLSNCGRKGPLTLAPYLNLPAPTGLSASQAKDILKLNWSFSGKTQQYFMVERKENGGAFIEIADPKTTTVSDLIDPGKEYEYRISAVSKANTPGAPANIKVKTIVPPGPPRELGFSILPDTIKLKWTPPITENQKVQFKIYKQIGPGVSEVSGVSGTAAALITPVPVSENNFADSPDPLEEVTYTVLSFVNGPVPCEGDSSSISIAPDDYVPSKAATPQGAVIANGVMLVWAPNPETWVQGYEIYKEENGTFNAVGQRRIPSFLDLGARFGRYRVSALGPVKEGPPSNILRVR